jgi:hypothetical protein
LLPAEGASNTGPIGAGVARPVPGLPTSRFVAALSIASAVGAAMAPVAPTASVVGDLFWLGLLGAIVPFAAVRSGLVPVLVVLVVAGLATTGWPLVLVAGGLGAALVGALAPRWVHHAAGLAGAFAINALLRSSGEVLADSSTLVAGAVAVSLVVGFGWRNAPVTTRRLTLRAVAVLGGVCLLSTAAAMVAVLLARPDLEAGVEKAQTGLDLAADADTEGARRQFELARGQLRNGHRHLARPWAIPGRALPVLGPNLRAATQLAGAGTRVADSALAVTEAADPDRLLVSGTQVDVDALSGTLPQLSAAKDAMLDAGVVADAVRSPWLVGPLTARIDTLDRLLDDALPRVDTLISVATRLPPMLGAEGPRRYLMLFTAPSETRGLGGFVGNWAILEIDDGRIALGERGRAADMAHMRGARRRVISGPQEYLDRYYRHNPHLFPVNVTSSPDFPTVGQVAAELYPQAGTPEVDGVILIDPSTLAALLEVTGPIRLPQLDEPLTTDNLEEFLWFEQYVVLGRRERIGALDALVDVMFDRLTSVELEPKRLFDALGPMVEARRLMVWSTRTPEARLLAELGVDGAFPRAEPGQDLLSVRTANANGNKIDYFLERHISYEATVDADTGQLEATVTIELHNSAVDDPMLPDYVLGNLYPDLDRAWNRQWVSLYTPHELVELRADGVVMESESMPELGVLTHALVVEVPPQDSVTITFRLSGRVDPERYTLIWSGQPTVRPDRLRLEIDTGRTTVESRQTTSGSFTLTERRRR